VQGPLEAIKDFVKRQRAKRFKLYSVHPTQAIARARLRRSRRSAMLALHRRPCSTLIASSVAAGMHSLAWVGGERCKRCLVRDVAQQTGRHSERSVARQ
jgi:hypothetical protein